MRVTTLQVSKASADYAPGPKEGGEQLNELK